MNQPFKPLSGEMIPPQLVKESVDHSDASIPVAAIATVPAPHDVEREVLHLLQNHPSLRFARLNVHQYDRDAVCLEGFLESNDAEIDLCEVVRGIHGIKHVVNRVLTPHPPESIPKKG
jgi:osmotically-inducible protein OsmY